MQVRVRISAVVMVGKNQMGIVKPGTASCRQPVEESCRKIGLDRVTVEELERLRARMPTPKMFS